MWVKLEYVTRYNKTIGHMANVNNRDGIKEILFRYNIKIEDIKRFEIDGKIYNADKLRELF